MSRHEIMYLQDIAGMRDMLADVYFGIDNDILSDVVKSKIPKLAKSVSAVLDKHGA